MAKYLFTILLVLTSVSCKSTRVFTPDNIPKVENKVFLKNNTEIYRENVQSLESLVKGSKVSYSNSQRAYIWSPPIGGTILSGKKQKGDGGQQEGQEPLMRVKVPLVLKGGKDAPWLIEDNKDGITFYENGWGLEGVVFLNSGEDCVTSYGKNGTIYKCKFIGDSDADKCLQFNVTDGAVVRNSEFYNFITAIQFGLRKYSNKTDISTAKNNKFVNCDTAIRAIKSKLKESGNNLGSAKIIKEN